MVDLPDNAARKDTAPLAGKHVLIVEDEVYVAMDLAALLADAGTTSQEARTADEALGMIEASRFDAAVLDIHLRRDSTYRVADALRAKGTPFVFLTGYLTVREGYANVPFLTKPYTAEAVRSALETLLRPAD